MNPSSETESPVRTFPMFVLLSHPNHVREVCVSQPGRLYGRVVDDEERVFGADRPHLWLRRPPEPVRTRRGAWQVLASHLPGRADRLMRVVSGQLEARSGPGFGCDG